ncbi:MAG TPA: hypothetical protein VF220_05450 [Nitrososphaeraceae archaeon]
MTRNTRRPRKIEELIRLAKKLEQEGCDRLEQMIGVILELKEKARINKDPSEQPSNHEMTGAFNAMYVNEKFGTVSTARDLRKVRRKLEKEHPYLKLHALDYREIDAHGNSIQRFYLTILEGKKQVDIVRAKLEEEMTALQRIIDGNEQASNVKEVRKQAKAYLDMLKNKRRKGVISS